MLENINVLPDAIVQASIVEITISIIFLLLISFSFIWTYHRIPVCVSRGKAGRYKALPDSLVAGACYQLLQTPGTYCTQILSVFLLVL